MEKTSHLTGYVFSSKLFRWDSGQRTFTAHVLQVPQCLRPLKSDDMVLGFGIKSEKTGHVALFSLESGERSDNTHSYLVWIFSPTPETLEEKPGLDGVKVRILNNT